MNTPAPNAPAPVAAARFSQLRSLIVVLFVNAVPLIGVLRYDWSAINVLVLYWFENVLIVAFTCVRLAVHRRLTRKKGYWRKSQLGFEVNDRPVQAGLLGEYATGAFFFTAVHGVFVGALALILHENFPDQPMWQFSAEQLLRGMLAITAMLGIELAMDLTHIRGQTFAAMRSYVEGRLGRIFVLHLTIIIGMFAMAMTESPMGILYALIALKTLADLGGIASRSPRPEAAASAPAPAWTMKLADRLGKDKGGAAGFLKKQKADLDQAQRSATEDEESMPAPPR